MKDAYGALKEAMRAKLTGKPSAEVVLAEYENDPHTYERPLATHVKEAGIDQDPRVVALAQNLMALMDADGSRAGKYRVNLTGAQGGQIGDGATQTNYFNKE